jgi:hypothetical protein
MPRHRRDTFNPVLPRLVYSIFKPFFERLTVDRGR